MKVQNATMRTSSRRLSRNGVLDRSAAPALVVVSSLLIMPTVTEPPSTSRSIREAERGRQTIHDAQVPLVTPVCNSLQTGHLGR